MSKRFSYRVIELKPATMGGFKPETMQEAFEKMGMQGWELVQVVASGPFAHMHAIFKKEG